MLTSFNGQTITYDEIGNPLQYRDGMSLTWAKGRQLQGIIKDGLNASYTYDENGLRISKTVNGVTTKIHRANGQMLGLNVSDGKDMTFILDGDGNVYGVHYDHYASNQPKSETYYFAYNAQGDVIGIYEFGGRLIATYDYDEWGNCTVNVLAEDGNSHAVDSPDHIAQVNPFRYRGYFYDAETGFYYLNSRYYDPGTGRFLNADELISTGQGLLQHNTYAYCNNNSINFVDDDGTNAKTIQRATGMAIFATLCAVAANVGGANIWNPVGWAILGVTAIGVISYAGYTIYQNSKTRSSSVSTSISKSVTKTKVKIRQEKKRYDYWIAKYVEYGNGRGTYIPTTPISYSAAIAYVRSGGNVFADSRRHAYTLARAVGNGKAPTRPERHNYNGSTLGYWWHYHDGNRQGGHIFYV